MATAAKIATNWSRSADRFCSALATFELWNPWRNSAWYRGGDQLESSIPTFFTVSSKNHFA